MPTNTKGRGVLPVTAAQTRKPQKQAHQPQQPRTPAPKLRMIVRRLPPGLTETEFWGTIGPEWKAGGGKVDWAAFRPGKISKDLAKPSRPARAYLKVKDQAHIEPLSTHIRATPFQDAKNTARDSCLVGPPTLEFAPYPKIPSTRVRHDGRQGTIDQDSEFIDFLQSLTEPIAKPAAEDSTENKNEKVTMTPLVQFIKEKKASKAKEKEAAVAATKSTKKTGENKDVNDAKDAKDSKASKASKNATPSKSEQTIVVKKGVQSDFEKARVAKATQQAMDSIKKSVAEIKGQSTPSKESKATDKKESTPTQSTPRKERQRGDASAAARIIGRDLGLVPKEGRTPRGQRAVTTPAQSSTPVTPTAPAAARALPQTPIPTAPAAAHAQNKTTPQPPTGPRNLRNQNTAASPLRAAQTPPASKGKPSPQLSNGAKSAFLKHANPSQGVTEELLRSTFSVHGAITRCEIDKKKGLGYIDFTDTESLKKAIAASPVKVGNGSVVVLENRTPYKKVSHGSAKNDSSSPAASIPSSPRVVQSNLATIAERAATPSIVTTTQPMPSAAASTPPPVPTEVKISDVTVSTDSKEPATQESSQTNEGVPEDSAPTSPSAPRGGRGNHRGHYHGRGYRGRGQARGGTRAASTPNPTAGAVSTAPTSSAAAGGTKT